MFFTTFKWFWNKKYKGYQQISHLLSLKAVDYVPNHNVQYNEHEYYFVSDTIRQELDHQVNNRRRNEGVQDLPANGEETEPHTQEYTNNVL